ncbi:polysaccharide deacetylase family protein [Maribacter aestuarii]|uniref:polysaccharide deacetylase family protein n=1 Tax=Maribacter aestuarii TaxID=1130723 RepID=UPI00248D06AE|nr:polysaccharide deacetylase family protein [Maribacter aestuarii]
MNNGSFVISLDFELMWGVRDNRTIDSYGANVEGVRIALPMMLELFRKYNIKATFATVGFLFAKTKKELLAYVPVNKPAYANNNLSPYNGYFELLKNSESEDNYHYGFSLINMLKQYPEQEIASHTFSHYYCLEPGQTAKAFEEDLKSAIAIARKNQVNLKSLVFPRNQFNKDYLKICSNLGITSFRGNENAKYYKAVPGAGDTMVKKIIRIVDMYLNLSGHNLSDLGTISKTFPYNIPSSRFLRPYNSKLRLFEILRLIRIKRSMTYAAKNSKVYHLWWHPHNFGQNQKMNFKILEAILQHYQFLSSKYNFESMTMNEITARIEKLK